MSAIDEVGFRRNPPVGVLPLGTGNDLSRSLEWGPGYSDTSLRWVFKMNFQEVLPEIETGPSSEIETSPSHEIGTRSQQLIHRTNRNA